MATPTPGRIVPQKAGRPLSAAGQPLCSLAGASALRACDAPDSPSKDGDLPYLATVLVKIARGGAHLGTPSRGWSG